MPLNDILMEVDIDIVIASTSNVIVKCYFGIFCEYNMRIVNGVNSCFILCD